MSKPPETIDRNSIDVLQPVIIETYIDSEMERSPVKNYKQRFGIEFKHSVQRAIAFLYAHKNDNQELFPDYEETIKWYDCHLTPRTVESWGNPDKTKYFYNCTGLRSASVYTWNTEFTLNQITVCKVVQVHYRSLMVPHNSEFHFMVKYE